MISVDNYKKIITIFLGLLVLILTSACASRKVDLVQQNAVTLEIVHSQGQVIISQAKIYEEEGSLLITGNVKSILPPQLSPRLGHVDVAILNSDGAVLQTLSIKHSAFRHKQIPRPFFSVRLPSIPPQGSRIRLAYHVKSHSMTSRTFDCGQNEALPTT